MVKAIEIIKYLESIYPESLKAKWDVTEGLIQGDVNKEIKKIIVAVELRKEIIETKADMIILHHPPIFGPEKIITNSSFKEIKDKDIIVYALHSRIDKSGDINKSLTFEIFGKNIKIDKILEDGTIISELQKTLELDNLIKIIKSKLNLSSLKFISKDKMVKRIAIHGGEGFNHHHVIDAVKENIDTYIAGDLSHHLAEHAFFYDVNFIDIEHHNEQFGLIKIKNLIENKFKLKCNLVLVSSIWSHS
jgi:GTP cyclohydrolase I